MVNPHMRIFKVLILVCLLIGCSSVPEAEKFKNQPLPASKPGYALVYIYRENHLAYDGKSVLILDGNQSLALLPNASYAYFRLAAGQHTISSLAWGMVGGTEYTGSFADGKIYFLKIEFKKFDPNLVLMEAAFTPVEPDVATDQISDLRISKVDK